MQGNKHYELVQCIESIFKHLLNDWWNQISSANTHPKKTQIFIDNTHIITHVWYYGCLFLNECLISIMSCIP
jgi:hypothetical protein